MLVSRKQINHSLIPQDFAHNFRSILCLKNMHMQHVYAFLTTSHMIERNVFLRHDCIFVQNKNDTFTLLRLLLKCWEILHFLFCFVSWTDSAICILYQCFNDIEEFYYFQIFLVTAFLLKRLHVNCQVFISYPWISPRLDYT
jgi:hypothetical protein